MAKEQKVVVQQQSVGVCSLLLVLFVALKLTGHIGWSWVWVVSPFWVPVAVALAVAVVALIVWGIASVVWPGPSSSGAAGLSRDKGE